MSVVIYSFAGGTSSSKYIGETAPNNPRNGQEWFKPSTSTSSTYYNGTWVSESDSEKSARTARITKTLFGGF